MFNLFPLNLQLFGFMPPDYEGENPLLMDDEPEVPEGELPESDVEEVPLDGDTPPPENLVPETQQPMQTQPPQGQLDQQGQGEGQPMPGEDFYSYMDRMKADILEQLPKDPATGQPEQPSEEELAMQNKEWMDRFYENPVGEIERLADEIANKKIEPLMKEREQFQKMNQINTDIERFRQQHPDMEEYTQDMVQIFQQMPELENTPHALDVAYKMAKGNRYDNTPKSMNDYLSDEDSISKLFEDEGFRQKAAKELMKHKKVSPKVLGSTGTTNSQSVLNDEPEIKSIADATKAFLASDY